MDVNLFLFVLWSVSVYSGECSSSRGKPKRGGLAETEPHPYTISFFTFPKGAASELLEPKRQSKRDNQDLSNHKKIKQVVPVKERKSKDDQKVASDSSKATKLPSKDSKIKETAEKPAGQTKHAAENKKNHQPFVQVAEKPNVLDKAGKAPEVGPQPGRQTSQPLEPWKLGPSHNKIQFKTHHAAHGQESAESYQEGSIKHPSHTMYPECHHCPSNSSYEDCVSRSTLKKCDNGLENICFTKSFYSNARGVIYEMGCSNHAQCQKAKAAPCKGAIKKCFVCCQFDGCNAMEHHYFQSKDDDDNLGYSAFSKATKSCKSGWSAVLIPLLLVAWMLT